MRPTVAATAAMAGRCGAFALAAAHLRRHDVVVQCLESQQVRGHRAVERERGAVSGGRSQRVLVGDVPRCGEHPHVVHQRFGIGPEPESERRGHGDLQVGVSRHQHLAVALALLLQTVEERVDVAGDAPQLIAQEELQIDQYLVVARASRVDLLAHVAQPAGEQQLDLGVDILRVGFDLEAPGLYLRGDFVQSVGEPPQFVGRQQADLLEHGDVCQRSLDVVARQPQVEFAVLADGVLLDHRVGFKSLVPKFSSHILSLNVRCNPCRRQSRPRSPPGGCIRRRRATAMTRPGPS